MKTKTNRTRTAFQISFFIFIAVLITYHNITDKGPSIHGICPFGGVVTFYKYITTGLFIKHIHFSSVIVMYSIIIFSVLFGGIFCSWVCPLGTFQELIAKIGKKKNKNYNKQVPDFVHKRLKHFRIIVLLWVIYVTARSGELLFANIDPYNALFNFWTGEVAIGALIMLGLVTLLSLAIERPWCKYLCPYGAFLGLFNKIRIFKIRRNKVSCINCKNCDDKCPMNIKVSEKEVISDMHCISCGLCTSDYQCPVEDTVTFSTKRRELVDESK